jgi:hypothetical protein
MELSQARETAKILERGFSSSESLARTNQANAENDKPRLSLMHFHKIAILNFNQSITT